MEKTKIEGTELYYEASEKNHEWGKGIRLSIYNRSNEFLGELVFSCHPEFNDFDLYQNYETDKLIKIATERIAKELPIDKYQQAWRSGLTLFLRFNSPNQQLGKGHA